MKPSGIILNRASTRPRKMKTKGPWFFPAGAAWQTLSTHLLSSFLRKSLKTIGIVLKDIVLKATAPL